MRKSIFISVANQEFAELRAGLRDALAKSFDVIVQPDFPASDSVVDTVLKLDSQIQKCDLLIHLVGRYAGEPADARAVANFFRTTPRETFLREHPEALALLGRFDGITYAQWEPWLALSRNRRTIIYAVPGHEAPDFPQRRHLDALKIARCHANLLTPGASGLAKIVADVFAVPELQVHEPELANNLQPPLPSFLLRARATLVEEYASLLSTASARKAALRLVLHGLGGVGKSRLATEIGHRFHRTGHHVLIADTVDRTQWDDDMAKLATDLNIRSSEMSKWLRDHHDWLLILDRVDDPDTQKFVVEFCCKYQGDPLSDHAGPRGHVLLTSRLRNGWPQSFMTREVKPVDGDAAVELLRAMLSQRGVTMSGRSWAACRDKLAFLLGGLPLAIEQAAAYLAETRSDLGEYIQRLSLADPTVLGFASGLEAGQLPVAKTWMTTFRRLPPDSRTLLRLLSFLSDDWIPKEMLQYPGVVEAFQAACESDPHETSRDSAPRPPEAALQSLSKYSLVTWNEPDSRQFAVHGLVQAVTQKETAREIRPGFWDKGLEFLMRVFDSGSQADHRMRFAEHPANFVSNYLAEKGEAAWIEIYPHALKLLSILSTEDPGGQIAATLRRLSAISLAFLAEAARRKGKRSDLERAHALIDVGLNKPGLKECDKLTLHRVRAATLFDQGRVPEAAAEATHALDLVDQVPSVKDHAEIRIGLLNIRGWCYRWLGDCARSIADYEGAIALVRNHGLSGAWEADLTAGLAGAHDYAGNYGEAGKLYSQATALARANSDVATEGFNLYMLGWFLIRNGHAEEGRALCDRSAQIGADYEFEAMINESSWIRAVHFGLLGDWGRALQMADLADEHSFELTEAWVKAIKGSILLRAGRKPEAATAFEIAIANVNEHFEAEPESFDYLDTKAIAQAGLALCGQTGAMQDARDTFLRAREMCSAQGVVDIALMIWSLLGDRSIPDNWLASGAA